MVNGKVKIEYNQCDIPKVGKIINIGLKKGRKTTLQLTIDNLPFTINQAKAAQVSKPYFLFCYVYNQKSP